MKILFVMHNQGFIPYYESVLRLLPERGHAIHLAFNQPFKPDEDPLAEMLATRTPGITYSLAPPRGDAWSALATAVRSAMDYLRYLHPRYKNAHKLRNRAAVWPLETLLAPARLPPLRTPAGIQLMTKCLKLIERAIPSSPRIEQFIAQHRPDVVLVTPLVETASKQVDYVKSAKALGIPTGLCVASWDNLTTKGLIRVEPDAVIVWNEIQRREAAELHGVPPHKVVVTGAQVFDEWFVRQPSTTRAEFCQQTGLAADRPFLLYLCSSPLIAGHEVPFVERWIQALRSSKDEAVRRVGILVRPHPQNARQWRGVDFSTFDNVAIWPRRASNRLDPTIKAGFFDSIFHSAAVVGINTSALIESAIIGRPALSILAPEYREVQTEMVQFHYLRSHSGGFLQVAECLEQHVEQVAEILRGRADHRDRARSFLASFVRPYGLDVPCTPILADAIEQVATRRVPAQRAPLWTYPLRWALLGPAALMNRAWMTVKDRVDNLAAG